MSPSPLAAPLLEQSVEPTSKPTAILAEKDEDTTEQEADEDKGTTVKEEAENDNILPEKNEPANSKRVDASPSLDDNDPTSKSTAILAEKDEDTTEQEADEDKGTTEKEEEENDNILPEKNEPVNSKRVDASPSLDDNANNTTCPHAKRKRLAYYPRPPCSEPGCTNKVYARGLCCRHGGGGLKKICRTEGCANMSVRGGVCMRHGGKVGCKVKGCSHDAVGGGVCVRHGGTHKWTRSVRLRQSETAGTVPVLNVDISRNAINKNLAQRDASRSIRLQQLEAAGVVPVPYVGISRDAKNNKNMTQKGDDDMVTSREKDSLISLQSKIIVEKDRKIARMEQIIADLRGREQERRNDANVDPLDTRHIEGAYL